MYSQLEKGSNSILSVTEEVHLDIIPTSSQASISFFFAFEQSSGSENLPTDGESRVLHKLWIDGELVIKEDELNEPDEGVYTKENVNIKPEGEDKKYQCTVTLKGKSKYQVHRISHREFSPEIDPLQKCYSERFIKGARIMVQCVPDNLRVRFVELGTLHEFERIVRQGAEDCTRRGDIAREYPPDKLLFPQQGYALIYQKIDKSNLDKKRLEEHAENAKKESEGDK